MTLVVDPWAGEGPRTEPLRLGTWTASVVGGGLDDLAVDGAPVLRGVRVVVRDADWLTVPVVEQRVTTDGSEARLDFRCTGLGGDFDCSLRVAPLDEGLKIEAVVVARTSFRRNRIGLVVLHDAALAGTAFQNGGVVSAFPDRIAPHQPATGIRTFRWWSDGREHRVDVEGDEFEMEDQRNWTDASFKTYGTPLALPFPVAVDVGDEIRQRVTVSSSTDGRGARVPSDPTPAVVELRDRGTRMPELAVAASTAPDAERPDEAASPPVDAVLVELRTADVNWPAAFARAVRDAAGLPLDVRIVVDGPDRLAAVLDVVIDSVAPAELVRLAVFDAASHVTEPHLWRALVDAAAARSIPATILVGGSRAHFAELNRSHGRLSDDLPAVAFGIAAEMHDTSTRQLIESVRMHRLVARDAVVIAAGRPVHVGPITLRPRFDAVATTPSEPDERTGVGDGYGPGRDPSTIDPRQAAPALEAWTIASVAALAGEHVASATYFEAWGRRGVHGTAAGRALERLRDFAGLPLLDAEGVPDDVAVLARTDGDRAHALVASLRGTETEIVLRHSGVDRVVRIPAYSVVAVEPW